MSFGAAGSLGFGIGITPIIGYEWTQLTVPPPTRNRQRLVYGGLLTLGIPLVSLEAEYTRGQTDETVGALAMTDLADRGKAGLRSSLGLGPFLSVYVRAGAQGSILTHTEKSGGVTVVNTQQPLVIYPYAGAGAQVRLSRNFYASAGVVAVIPNVNDLTRNEYQTTAGFSIRLP